jgi:hypothetical protein
MEIKKYVVTIYPSALKQFKVSPSDAILLDVILQQTVKFGFCFLSKADIATLLGITTDSAFKKLRGLKEQRLVFRAYPSDQEWSTYLNRLGIKNVPKNGKLTTSCYRVAASWGIFIQDIEKG